ncbi:biotin-dependent carboxyltransferase family protein [Domibacillus enclensis]|uniref:Antagonist of KipI n=1 Tax=Domibacillus enclensis TaxID=1017273 RepID=A0A1N6WWG4_9BACI|nr:biotin-dependent carboxyltransferase family protein [Domibacillus enclensis]OXS78050.1 KipI antagonist [Domibacillus enclensis]SIQ94393.1 antagonist of KipI [Domibacillus enclensis]
MSVKVIRSGLLASIQDLGRHGFQKHGVIVSGAMDPLSLRLANILAGNKEGEAAIEVTMMGTSLAFERDAIIAITGGDLNPVIEGKQVPLWRPLFIEKGSILHFTACRSGCRAYVAVFGGYEVPEVMDSKSTYLRGKVGGHKGRALQVGDVLEFSQADHSHHPLFLYLKKKKGGSCSAVNWHVRPQHAWHQKRIRVMPGPEFDRFSPDSRAAFFQKSFRVSPQSDRMGYRLSGPLLELNEPADLLSEAVAGGTIQVPQDGNPILLMADHQTTGGYPRIAQAASVDLPAVAQLKPGEQIRFKQITWKRAEQLYMNQETFIQMIKKAVSFKINHQGRR